MKKKGIISLCLVVLVIFGGFMWFKSYMNNKLELASRIHTSIPFYSLGDLMEGVEVIIRGTVDKENPGKWSNPDFVRGKNIRNTITTDIGIKIKEVYKGTPYDNKYINLRVAQGKIGDKKIMVDVYPTFTPGEEVILFLVKDGTDIKTDENYYALAGFWQGKLDLKGKEGDDLIFGNKRNPSVKLNDFKKQSKASGRSPEK